MSVHKLVSVTVAITTVGIVSKVYLSRNLGLTFFGS